MEKKGKVDLIKSYKKKINYGELKGHDVKTLVSSHVSVCIIIQSPLAPPHYIILIVYLNK